MRIFLIRHGESVANVDGSLYAHYEDSNVPLSEWGYEQAREAGAALKAYYESREDLQGRKPRIWHSPFKRTRQTTEALIETLGAENVDQVRENTLLRERDYGIFGNVRDFDKLREMFPDEFGLFEARVEKGSKFYAKAHPGESLANVVDRMHTFIAGQVMLNLAAGNEDMVIVAHGEANRAFQMAFLGSEFERPPEWYQDSKNPGNCDILMIEGDLENGFETTLIHESKKRSQHLPQSYKTAPYGEPGAEQAKAI